MTVLLAVLAMAFAVLAAGSVRADDPWDVQGTSDDLPVVTSEDGVDRPGNDFWLIRMPGPAAFGPCALYCRGTPRCGAYTVVRPTSPGGPYLCYLKDRVPAPVRDGCCLSGVKENFRPLTAEQIARDPRLARTPRFGEAIPGPATNPARPPVVLPPLVPTVPLSPLPPTPTPSEPPFGAPIPGVSAIDGTDRMGGDYRRIFPATTARACAEACAGDQPRCRAYTFVRAGYQESEPVCYLKETVPPETPDACCLSGVVDGPGSNAAPTPARPVPAAGSYDRVPGRYEGAGETLINNWSSGDRRWPASVGFNIAGCEAACDDPARFNGGSPESRRCMAYSFMQAHGPNPATCTIFGSVPPRVAPDDNTMSGRRR
jgi:hypothetical protein